MRKLFVFVAAISIVAGAAGVASAAVLNWEGTLTVIIGENPRQDDMNVNPTKEKKATNIRSSTQEATEVLATPRSLSLEQALEFVREDECLEVTPKNVRLRKVILSQNDRSRAKKVASIGA